MLLHNSLLRAANPFLIRHFSHSLRTIQVVEYPKCGGTWLARILRSYFGVTRETGVTKFVRRNAVFQTHELLNTRFHRSIVIARDPRDVLVSYYFHERYLENKKWISFDAESSDALNLHHYVRRKLENPKASFPGFTYEEFVKSWDKATDAVWTSYEALHCDTPSEIKKIICALGHSYDEDRGQKAIDEHDFKKITGRNPGENMPNDHKRIGIVGDWKNYFFLETGALVQKHQAELLMRFGAETRDDWYISSPPMSDACPTGIA